MRPSGRARAVMVHLTAAVAEMVAGPAGWPCGFAGALELAACPLGVVAGV